MNKKLGLLTIHGMGETKTTYYAGLKESIEKRLGWKIWEDIHLEPIYYQHPMQEHEYRVWRDMPREEFEWKRLRQFMLFAFADASTLEHKPDKPGSIYRKVQTNIFESLKKTREALGNENKEIILVAQSLGGQVISNYIWDFQCSFGIWE